MNLHIDKISTTEKYLQNSKRYYDNSQLLIKEKEFEKAGELLWGAIAEVSKALHVTVKGQPISSHGQVRKYLNQLLIQERRGRIKKEHVWAADQLHTNFYEANLLQENQVFFEQYEYGKILYGYLLDLVREYPHI